MIQGEIFFRHGVDHVSGLFAVAIAAEIRGLLHNTSVAMVEKTYSKHITEHSDDISRKALLQHDEELQTVVSDNVIALAS